MEERDQESPHNRLVVDRQTVMVLKNIFRHVRGEGAGSFAEGTMTTPGLSMTRHRARTRPVPRLAVGFGASTLGRRFRVYSLATLATVIVFGALSAPVGVRLAAGEPAPGFGIIERIHVDAFMLWLAVFAIALLQRPTTAAQPLLQ